MTLPQFPMVSYDIDTFEGCWSVFFWVWDVLQLGFVWYFLVIILRLCVTKMDSTAGGASLGHHTGIHDVDMF